MHFMKISPISSSIFIWIFCSIIWPVGVNAQGGDSIPLPLKALKLELEEESIPFRCLEGGHGGGIHLSCPSAGNG